METLHWIILAGLVLAFLVVLKVILSRPNLGKIACSVRQSFCSMERRKFWLSLQQAVGDDYVVLANVPLATLVAADGDDGGPLLDWLQEHWADFAILHEELFMPVAVVQFERQAEEEDPIWPRGKDPTLERVLNQAGLTLLWLPSDRYQHVELLRHALEQARAQGETAADMFKTAKGSD
jgi:hypothetical protein